MIPNRPVMYARCRLLKSQIGDLRYTMASAHAGALRFAFAAAALVGSRDIPGANAQSTCTGHSDCPISQKYPGLDFDLEIRADGKPARQSQCSSSRHSFQGNNFSKVEQCADACRGQSQWFKFGRETTYERFIKISHNCKDKSPEEQVATQCRQGPCTEVLSDRNGKETLCECYCEAEAVSNVNCQSAKAGPYRGPATSSCTSAYYLLCSCTPCIYMVLLNLVEH
jgi:hypothetical protein